MPVGNMAFSKVIDCSMQLQWPASALPLQHAYLLKKMLLEESVNICGHDLCVVSDAYCKTLCQSPLFFVC